MGNFLYNVHKSREEWLKKPNPIPNRAVILNASLNTNLTEGLVTDPEEPAPAPHTETISEETISE